MEIINENVVGLFIALRRFEAGFTQEFKALEKKNPDLSYDKVSDEFWNGYTKVLDCLKVLLAETTDLNARLIN